MERETAKEIVQAMMKRLDEQLGEDEKFALSTLLFPRGELNTPKIKRGE